MKDEPALNSTLSNQNNAKEASAQRYTTLDNEVSQTY